MVLIINNFTSTSSITTTLPSAGDTIAEASMVNARLGILKKETMNKKKAIVSAKNDQPKMVLIGNK